jgi:hypothetical protein
MDCASLIGFFNGASLYFEFPITKANRGIALSVEGPCAHTLLAHKGNDAAVPTNPTRFSHFLRPVCSSNDEIRFVFTLKSFYWQYL